MSRFYTLVFILLISAFGQSALAQQQENKAATSLLPEIDPQDIEIRSQFRARFPGLMRQPILGFNPDPRVYRIDPDRMPFLETSDQVVASIPVSELSRPAPPEYVPLRYNPRINAFARAGFGSYASPEVQFWGVTRFDNKSYVGGDLKFNSSSGHLDAQPSSFRNVDANVEFGTKLNPKTQLDVFGGIKSDFLHVPVTGTPIQNPNVGRREISGFRLGSEIRSMKNSVQGWSAEASFRSFTVDQVKDLSTVTGNEWVYETAARYQWAGSEINEVWQVKGGIRGGMHNTNSGSTFNWNTFSGAVVYDRLFNYSTKVVAEAGVAYTSNEMENKVYVAPSLMVKHWIADDLTIEGRLKGAPHVYTREELNGLNRFMQVGQGVPHTYELEIAGEINYAFFGESNLYAGLSYKNIENYPIFQKIFFATFPGGGGIAEPDLYRAVYARANIYKIYGGLSHQVIAEKLWFNATGYIQVPKHNETGISLNSTRIPYTEVWGMNGGISFKPFDRMKLEAWGDIVGPKKYESPANTLKAILLLGGRIDIELTDRFGAYAKMVNLLNQEYRIWPGYPERPFQAFGGITVKF